MSDEILDGEVVEEITSVCVKPSTGEVACWGVDGQLPLTQEAGIKALQGLMVTLASRDDFNPMAFQSALMAGMNPEPDPAPVAPVSQSDTLEESAVPDSAQEDHDEAEQAAKD